MPKEHMKDYIRANEIVGFLSIYLACPEEFYACFLLTPVATRLVVGSNLAYNVY